MFLRLRAWLRAKKQNNGRMNGRTRYGNRFRETIDNWRDEQALAFAGYSMMPTRLKRRGKRSIMDCWPAFKQPWAS